MKKRKYKKTPAPSKNEPKSGPFQKAISLHQQGHLGEAIRLYDSIRREDPNHSECVYLSALALYQTGDDKAAVQRLREAIGIKNDNPNYYNLLGQILLENKDFADAMVCFQHVVSLDSGFAGVHNTLGLAYHALGDFDEAENHFNKELIKRPDDINTYNNLGLLFKDEGLYDKALQLFDKALDINPDFHIALNNRGLILLDQGLTDQAIDCFKRVIHLESGFFNGWLNLAIAQLKLSYLDESMKNAITAKEICPDSIEVYSHIVNVCLEKKDLCAAESFLAEALKMNPEHPEILYLQGLIFHEQGDLEKAAKFYNRCLSFNPKHPGAFNNSGNIFQKMNLCIDAEQCYLKAIEYKHDYADAYCNLGMLYMGLNFMDKALEYYNKAIELNPDKSLFYLNKGVLYQKTGEMDLASVNFIRALALNWKLVEALYHLGEIARLSNDLKAAISYYEKALELDPENSESCDQLAYVFQRVCLWDKAKIKIDQLVELTDKAIKSGTEIVESPHNLLNRRDDPEVLFHVSRAWSDKIFHSVASLSPGYHHTKKTKDKITIGYFSNTFKNHPGGHLIAGLFQHHDRNRFRVICYSYGEDDQSYYRKKVEKDADIFKDIRLLNDKIVADTIYSDGVDILVDLRGHTGGSRMNICAMKPAPIQVVYLGFPGTSGADFFDYIIADKTVAPKEHQEYFSENIVYMPGCYQVNNNEQTISNEVFTRKNLGLPEEGFVFCSFNTAYKIEPVMFDCWMEILKLVPESVLWLLKDNDEMVLNLLNEIESRGVDKERLIFADQMPKERHLKRIQLADLGLDTRICSGHTTTSDSLWAGVPVITMSGNHFASRVSASILLAAGFPELVVPSLERYKELAVDLAINKGKLLTLKQRIQENKTTQPLFNTQLFATNIEKAYEIMWERFVAGETFDVIEL